MNEGSGRPSIAPRGRAGGRLRRRLERRSALVLVGLFAGAWIVFIFAGALARANDLDAALSDARARTAAVAAQVEAGYEEIEFIESDAFLEQAARGLGFGAAGEVPFALPEDAPSPPPIARIGGSRTPGSSGVPLDDWLDLLFGPG